ncbi:MAG: DNA recombination protein RmuC [Bacteroidaceae bacterium]|nr:DNA recombination protein RmuC [Bacteroidaceae bacterium]
MFTIVYVVIALIVGSVVTYLVSRMKYEKRLNEGVRELERAKMEGNMLQNEIRRVSDELVQTRNHVGRLEMEKSSLDIMVTRLETEKNTVAERCKELSDAVVRSNEQCDEINRLLSDEKTRYATLQVEYQTLQEKLVSHKSEMEKLNDVMLLKFRDIASSIMDEKTRTFKDMSRENLKIILEPLNRDIEGFKKQVEQCYETESRERTSLQEQIKQLAQQNEKMRREADKLSSALRGGTKVQGNWGEMILQNILQQSGLREGIDFDIQKTVDAVGDNKRPDVILHFPSHNDLIIDSKVSFTAYDKYMNAENDDERRIYAAEHLTSVINHIDGLAKRDYSSSSSKAYDFVIMFMPIESMFMLALDQARVQGKNLWNDAYAQRIIIMTPTNLLLTVRMLQDMWRQHDLETNIRAIKTRAEKMYNQFVLFATDIEAVRVSLDNAVGACDNARKRLTWGNDNLMLQFEKMRVLGLDPKTPSKQARNSWKKLQEDAGVTEDSNRLLIDVDEESTEQNHVAEDNAED